MPRRRNKRPGTLQWWSDKQRIQAVTTWLALGNLSLTAATLNIPEDTMRRWKAQPWWEQMVKEIRAENNLKLDGKLSQVVEKSIDQLVDRVENGDFVFNQKTGKLIRKPINARDASKITGDMIDRKKLLQGEKEVKDSQKNVEETLLKLSEEFKRFAKAKEIVVLPEGRENNE